MFAIGCSGADSEAHGCTALLQAQSGVIACYNCTCLQSTKQWIIKRHSIHHKQQVTAEKPCVGASGRRKSKSKPARRGVPAGVSHTTRTYSRRDGLLIIQATHGFAPRWSDYPARSSCAGGKTACIGGWQPVQFSSVQFSSVQFSSVQFSSVRFGSVRLSSVHFNSAQFAWAGSMQQPDGPLCWFVQTLGSMPH